MNRADKSIDAKVSKEADSIESLNKKLKNKDFECVEDAKKFACESVKKLKYHTCTGVMTSEKNIIRDVGNQAKRI